MMNKAVVILSGGLDSGVLLAKTVEEYGPESVHALSFSYGQKQTIELDYASDIARYYNIAEHKIVSINRDIFAHSNCSLIDASKPITKTSYKEAENTDQIKDLYVPFRNGLLLSLAASYSVGLAQSEGTKIDLFYGAHAGDSGTGIYPDTTPRFYSSMRDAIDKGTAGKINLKAPFIDYKKYDIIKEGSKLDVPFETAYSCYEGGVLHCGTCPTCRDRKESFERAGVYDPTSYVQK